VYIHTGQNITYNWCRKEEKRRRKVKQNAVSFHKKYISLEKRIDI